MSQDNEKDEPSVDEILSSIKDVIASDKDVSNNEEDNDVVMIMFLNLQILLMIQKLKKIQTFKIITIILPIYLKVETYL